MEKTPEEIISDYMAKLGRKGGATLKKRGSEYFSQLSKKGWAKKKSRQLHTN